MNITIDASRLLTKNPTGVEVYCQQIIKGLLAKSNELILYTPKVIKDLPQERQKILNWPADKLWSQIRLGLELLIHPPDVFFSPGYVIPFLALLNKKTKKIVTIHDVGFVHTPESYSRSQKWFLNVTTRQAVQHAHRIMTPTQATKDDLIKYFNCPQEKIMVTHLGYGKRLTTNDLQQTTIKKQVLYIGRIEEKKNIKNLLKAFQFFNKKFPEYKLILAGKLGYGFKDLKFISRKSFVVSLGYISEEKKRQLLSESSCLVYISKYEGFGLPLLEAFSYNLPVLASDIPVLKEVGADACLFVNPSSPEDIAQGLEKITQDNNLRQELIQKGKTRLNSFNWAECVDKTWQILN